MIGLESSFPLEGEEDGDLVPLTMSSEDLNKCKEKWIRNWKI